MAEMSVAEMSIGRNVRGRDVCGRNVLTETSVAEMSVAEMSEHRCGHFNLPCDLDHLNKFLFLLHKEALHEIWIDWPSGFRGDL